MTHSRSEWQNDGVGPLMKDFQWGFLMAKLKGQRLRESWYSNGRWIIFLGGCPALDVRLLLES